MMAVILRAYQAGIGRFIEKHGVEYKVEVQERRSLYSYGTTCWTTQAWQGFSLLHSVQTDTGAHPASYPMGTRADSPGVKAAVA
jgi:hypothetical protein